MGAPTKLCIAYSTIAQLSPSQPSPPSLSSLVSAPTPAPTAASPRTATSTSRTGASAAPLLSPSTAAPAQDAPAWIQRSVDEVRAHLWSPHRHRYRIVHLGSYCRSCFHRWRNQALHDHQPGHHIRPVHH